MSIQKSSRIHYQKIDSEKFNEELSFIPTLKTLENVIQKSS
jgi:hypothetical protein